jgi:hypothetical protein
VIDDFQSFAVGLGGLDYVKDAATVDKLGNTVEFPDAVSDSYGTWQDAIDKISRRVPEDRGGIGRAPTHRRDSTSVTDRRAPRKQANASTT